MSTQTITITCHPGAYRRPTTYSIGSNVDEANGDWADAYILPAGYTHDAGRNVIIDPAGNACRLTDLGGAVICSDDERYTATLFRV